MGQANEKPRAELTGRGNNQRISIRVDDNTIVTMKVNKEDKKRFPELFKRKPAKDKSDKKPE